MNQPALHAADPVQYDCPAERLLASLTALWYLDTEQGAEGLVSPVCTDVTCSHASTCNSLAQGCCPLTFGYGDVMNTLGVRLTHDVLDPVVQANMQMLALSKFHPAYPIWFGRTTVLSSVGNVEA
jgi:hypothetical protein